MTKATPVDSTFYLRCIADSEDEATVLEVVERLTRSLVPDSAVVSRMVEPYPKFPGTTDIIIYLEAGHRTKQLFGQIRDRLGTGWSWERSDGDGSYYWASSVWNRSKDATFVDSRVRWAHLECHLRITP